jgi:hypothetical protein
MLSANSHAHASVSTAPNGFFNGRLRLMLLLQQLQHAGGDVAHGVNLLRLLVRHGDVEMLFDLHRNAR